MDTLHTTRKELLGYREWTYKKCGNKAGMKTHKKRLPCIFVYAVSTMKRVILQMQGSFLVHFHLCLVLILFTGPSQVKWHASHDTQGTLLVWFHLCLVLIFLTGPSLDATNFCHNKNFLALFSLFWGFQKQNNKQNDTHFASLKTPRQFSSKRLWGTPTFKSPSIHIHKRAIYQCMHTH